MWSIARAVLAVLLVVLLAPPASADIVQVDVDLQWTVPYLTTPVRFTGSELWENGVGYVVPKISTQRWEITGTGCPTCVYFDLLTLGSPPPPNFLITVEAFTPSHEYRYFFIPFGDLPTVVLDPGDYDISWSFFQDGFSGTNVFFATEGYQRVSAVSVPELGSLLLLAVGLVCLAGARRLRRV